MGKLNLKEKIIEELAMAMTHNIITMTEEDKTKLLFSIKSAIYFGQITAKEVEDIILKALDDKLKDKNSRATLSKCSYCGQEVEGVKLRKIYDGSSADLCRACQK